MSNDGRVFEKQAVEALNNLSVMKLPNNIKFLIEKIFGTLNNRSNLICEHAMDFTKPDIILSYHDEQAYISLKTGTACEVHREKIETIIPYLRSLGISEETLKTIVLFQFGDGTYNGSGRKRLNSHDTFHWLRDKIAEANEELNRSHEFTLKVMDRVIFQGILADAKPAQYIYHGSMSEGILVSRDQVRKYFERKNFDFLENLHIGPLLLRPHARYAGKKIENETSRRELVFYWPNFRVDLEYIDKRYGF